MSDGRDPERKRQHSIPAVYLRQFAIPGKSQEQVYQHKKSTREVFPNSVGNATVVKRLYSYVDAEGDWVDAYERKLDAIEGQAAGPLRRIALGDELSGEQKQQLALFIASLYSRPYRRSRALMQFLEEAWGDYDKRLQVWERSQETLRLHFSQTRIEEDDAFVRDMSSSADTMGTMKQAMLDAVFDSLPDIARIIFDMHWQVLRAPRDSYFLTSDSPVLVRCPADWYATSVTPLLNHAEDAELLLPLSPQRFLVAGCRPRQPQSVASKSRAKELNRLTIELSDRWVFSDRQTESISALIDQATHPGIPLPPFIC